VRGDAVSGQGAPVVEIGSKRTGSDLQGKVVALEDEVDFLSLKLKEEEGARKAAEREAHRCIAAQGLGFRVQD
jgi:hypothetical protein